MRFLSLFVSGSLVVSFSFFSPFSSANQASIDAIKQFWPEDLQDIALRIAYRESNYIPSVTGCSGKCTGLFQIMYSVHRSWLVSLGITNQDQLKDPEINARAAYHLFKITGEDWSPWCHPSGFPVFCH